MPAPAPSCTVTAPPAGRRTALPFSTVTNVPRDRFRWTRGESLIRGFESSPGKQRYFCTQCGSHIVAERAGTGTILLRMGCLDTPIAERPKVHIWRSDAAPWFDPKDL